MSLSTAPVTVAATSTVVASGGASGARVHLKNSGAASVFLGSKTVTGSTDGYTLAATEVLDLVLAAGVVLYGIVATGTNVIQAIVTSL